MAEAPRRARGCGHAGSVVAQVALASGTGAACLSPSLPQEHLSTPGTSLSSFQNAGEAAAQEAVTWGDPSTLAEPTFPLPSGVQGQATRFAWALAAPRSVRLPLRPLRVLPESRLGETNPPRAKTPVFPKGTLVPWHPLRPFSPPETRAPGEKNCLV